MTEILLSSGLLIALLLALTIFVMTARSILVPSGPVKVTVNDTTEIWGQCGDKLLSVLKDGGLEIPSACAGAGTCGLCRVQLVDGSGPPLATETSRLSPTEIREGTRLACQTVLRGPLSVVVPDDVLSAETITCELLSARMLAPLIREIVLRVPESAGFEPRAGSFVQITAPPYSRDFSQVSLTPEIEQIWTRMGWRKLHAEADSPTIRAYSLANRPQDRGTIVLTVRLAIPPGGSNDIPPGIVSSYLFLLAPGDKLEVSGPFGTFGAQDTNREMVFIGGGVGIAPLRAIIHDQLERAKTTRRMSFWCGARSETDAFYDDELRELDARHENFTYRLALSEPANDQTMGALQGFIHEVAFDQYLRGHPAPGECEYYLCGPPLMIQAVRSVLARLGVEDEMIFFDDFGA